MCATCACETGHEHEHASGSVRIEQGLLAKNERAAEVNRAWLAGRRIAAFNLTSSPGAGKTTLLEQTIRRLSGDVVVSVIEGEDEPLKYPHMFRAAEVLVVNKIDLLPHVSFDMDLFLSNAMRVNPGRHVHLTSATRGDGLSAWCSFLRSAVAAGADEEHRDGVQGARGH